MYGFMDKEKANHAIRIMCRVLGVSPSGYYKWLTRKPSLRAIRDAELKSLIKRIHANSRDTYGSPRVHAELRIGHGIRCSRKRVARLMREAGLRGAHRGRPYGCTRRNPKRPVYPDLVKRDFSADAPNRLWVADMTQHQTDEGWLYLAAVTDMYSRMVIGWSMADRATVDLVLGAINMAVQRRRPETGVTHHSDHGSQYTSVQYGKRLQDAGIVGSMGSVGDALDNAAAESLFSTIQVELFDTKKWKTRRELKSAIFEYIEVFYNRKRRHSSLEYLTPYEFENRRTDVSLVAND